MRFSYGQRCAFYYLDTKIVRNFASLVVAFKSLRTCPTSSGRCLVTRCAILAHGTRIPCPGVSPYIGGLHTAIPVLAISDRLSMFAFKLWHLSHQSPRVLNEPNLRIDFVNDSKRFSQKFDSEFCGFCFWDICSASACPMVTNSGNAESSTRRRSPYHVGLKWHLFAIKHQDVA